jgi:hypothetical protein
MDILVINKIRSYCKNKTTRCSNRHINQIIMMKKLVIVKVHDEIITKPPKNGKKEMVEFKLHNEAIQQETNIQQ